MVTYLGICALVFLFAVGAEPIQWIKSLVHVQEDAEYKNKVQYFFVKLLNCSLCVGFWVGLIFYHSIILAGLVSIGSEFIARRL